MSMRVLLGVHWTAREHPAAPRHIIRFGGVYGIVVVSRGGRGTHGRVVVVGIVVGIPITERGAVAVADPVAHNREVRAPGALPSTPEGEGPFHDVALLVDGFQSIESFVIQYIRFCGRVVVVATVPVLTVSTIVTRVDWREGPDAFIVFVLGLQ
jgi:hypothetical protein